MCLWKQRDDSVHCAQVSQILGQYTGYFLKPGGNLLIFLSILCPFAAYLCALYCFTVTSKYFTKYAYL